MHLVQTVCFLFIHRAKQIYRQFFKLFYLILIWGFVKPDLIKYLGKTKVENALNILTIRLQEHWLFKTTNNKITLKKLVI